MLTKKTTRFNLQWNYIQVNFKYDKRLNYQISSQNIPTNLGLKNSIT